MSTGTSLNHRLGLIKKIVPFSQKIFWTDFHKIWYVAENLESWNFFVFNPSSTNKNIGN